MMEAQEAGRTRGMVAGVKWEKYSAGSKGGAGISSKPAGTAEMRWRTLSMKVRACFSALSIPWDLASEKLW